MVLLGIKGRERRGYLVETFVKGGEVREGCNSASTIGEGLVGAQLEVKITNRI
jgi:hypothetical protein